MKNIFPNFFRILILKILGVKVGKGVYVNEGLTFASTIGYENLLIIEDRVAIAPNLSVILTSDPNNSYLIKLSSKYGFINRKENILIKHDSWIGMNVTILPGITIGEFSIIGAGSVVTEDVPAYSIAVGIPAKVIKSFTEEDKQILKDEIYSQHGH